jgi:hypothetical protein
MRSSQRRILQALNPSPLPHNHSNNHSNWNNPTRTRLRQLLDERNNDTANVTAPLPVNATTPPPLNETFPESRLTDLPAHRERLSFAENMQTLEGDTFQVSSDDEVALDYLLNKMIAEWNMTLTTDCSHLGSNIYNNSQCNNKDDNYELSRVSIDNCGDEPVSDNFDTRNFTQYIDDACAFPPHDETSGATLLTVGVFFLAMIIAIPATCMVVDRIEKNHRRAQQAIDAAADDDHDYAPLLLGEEEEEKKRAEMPAPTPRR